MDQMELLEDIQNVVSLISDLLDEKSIDIELKLLDDTEHGLREILLTQLHGNFDYCDVSVDEQGSAYAIEFTINESHQASEKPLFISIPIDQDDIEVNLLDDGLDMESRDYALSIRF